MNAIIARAPAPLLFPACLLLSFCAGYGLTAFASRFVGAAILREGIKLTQWPALAVKY